MPPMLSAFHNHLMGVINCTPDSFSDGGRLGPGDAPDVSAALAQARRMIADGAAVLDVGGEATSFHRAGIGPVDAARQLARVIPLIAAIRQNGLCRMISAKSTAGTSGEGPRSCYISIDTRDAFVARAALAAGAAIINDVSAGLADPRMFEVAAESKCPIILMHARFESPGGAATADDPAIIENVTTFLSRRAQAAVHAGVGPDAIMIDPGIGFGKSAPDNWRLLANLSTLGSLGFPVVLGISRKRFLERAGPRPAAAAESPDWPLRDALTAATTALLADAGVALHRVHNVRAARLALDAAAALDAGTRR